MLQLTAIGHLGQDAEVKQIGGKTVINFSVPHSRTYTNKEGVQVKDTTWIQCAKWTEHTKIATFLRKGQQVYVIGEPQLRSYTNMNGQHIAQLQLNVSHIELLGSGKRENAEPAVPSQTAFQQTPVPAATQPEDDLPF